jgi:hypothetical protein
MSNKYPNDLIDISEIPYGTILRDWYDDGVRVVIVRANISMNVYLGVPSGHPLAGHSYDLLSLACHGGLTFSREGDDEYLPKGYYWYGYDYAHAGDYCWYPSGSPDFMENEKKWSLGEIVNDTHTSIYDFKKFVRLAEEIRI